MVSVLGLCLSQGIAWAQGAGNAKEFALQASLDPILDWRAPLSLSSEKLEAAYVANGFSSSPYYGWSSDKTKAHLGRKPFSNITVDLTAFGGKLPIEDV